MYQKFSQHGLKPGQRVAVLSHNSAEMLILLHALIEFGATAAPLHTRFPREQLAGILRRLQPQHLFSTAGLRDQLPIHVQPIIIEDFLQNTSAAPNVSAQNSSLNFENSATMLLTSGSAGVPKIAVHSYANHFYSACGSQQNIKLDRKCRWLLSLPLYHTGGLAIGFRTFLAGATVVIPPPDAALLDSISKHKITHLSLVTTQLQRLLDQQHGAETLKTCRAILLGGSAIESNLIERAHTAGLPLHTSYGSTEMSSQICTTPPGATISQLKTSGQILPEREVKISPDAEILLRGKTLFCGYFENGKIRQAVDDAGYFHSGDSGYFDAAGNLVVRGRRDNLIISGGENIQPEEVEEAISQIAGIRQVVVVGVADAEFGQRPVAFVSGGEKVFTPDKLRRLLAKKIARFKIPDQFYPWPEDADFGLKINREFFVNRARERQKMAAGENGDHPPANRP